jgi:hypothetical protein
MPGTNQTRTAAGKKAKKYYRHKTITRRRHEDSRGTRKAPSTKLKADDTLLLPQLHIKTSAIN